MAILKVCQVQYPPHTIRGHTWLYWRYVKYNIHPKPLEGIHGYILGMSSTMSTPNHYKVCMAKLEVYLVQYPAQAITEHAWLYWSYVGYSIQPKPLQNMYGYIVLEVCLVQYPTQTITGHVYPDSNIHGANMGPIWGRQDPGGPHVGLMNHAIWVDILEVCQVKGPL